MSRYDKSYSDIANMIYNPVGDGYYFDPLPEEVEERDGNFYLKQESVRAYVDRFLATPEGAHYSDRLADNAPEGYGVKVPTWGEIYKHDFQEADDWLNPFFTKLDRHVKDFTGLADSPQHVPEITPEKFNTIYNEGIKSGLTDLEIGQKIWPWLNHPSYITQKDESKAIADKSLKDRFLENPMALLQTLPGSSLNYLTQEIRDKWKDKDTINPESEILDRMTIYKKGGYIDGDGKIRTSKGNDLSQYNKPMNPIDKMLGNKDSEFIRAVRAITPLEYTTRWAYEKRKRNNASFTQDGVWNGVKQGVYEFLNPIGDYNAMKIEEHQKARWDNPAYVQYMKYFETTPWEWGIVHPSRWSDLTTKTTQLGLNIIPSYVVPFIMGAVTKRFTGSTMAATGVSMTSGATMDSQGTYLEAYNFARDELKLPEHHARKFAYEHYDAYFLASMAWEMTPFAMAFKRMQPIRSLRRAKNRSVVDKNLKNTSAKLANDIKNGVSFQPGRIRNAFIQSAAESITELGQYTNEIYIQAGYKKQNFADIFDVQQALDAIIGGGLMGGPTGFLTGGKPKVEGTDEVKAPTTPVKPTESPDELGKPIETDGEGVPAISSYPQDVDSYITMIAQQEKDDTVLNYSLVGMQKKMGGDDSRLGRAIKRDLRIEDYPIRKLFNIMEDKELNPGGGLSFIENSSLDDATKKDLKQKLMIEYKQRMGVEFKKKTLSPTEQGQKIKLDELSIDDMVNAASNKMPTLDDLISKKAEEKALEETKEMLGGQTVEELRKQGKVKKVQKAKISGVNIQQTPKSFEAADDSIDKPIKHKKGFSDKYVMMDDGLKKVSGKSFKLKGSSRDFFVHQENGKWIAVDSRTGYRATSEYPTQTQAKQALQETFDKLGMDKWKKLILEQEKTVSEKIKTPPPKKTPTEEAPSQPDIDAVAKKVGTPKQLTPEELAEARKKAKTPEDKKTVRKAKMAQRKAKKAIKYKKGDLYKGLEIGDIPEEGQATAQSFMDAIDAGKLDEARVILDNESKLSVKDKTLDNDTFKAFRLILQQREKKEEKDIPKERQEAHDKMVAGLPERSKEDLKGMLSARGEIPDADINKMSKKQMIDILSREEPRRLPEETFDIFKDETPKKEDKDKPLDDDVQKTLDDITGDAPIDFEDTGQELTSEEMDKHLGRYEEHMKGLPPSELMSRVSEIMADVYTTDVKEGATGPHGGGVTSGRWKNWKLNFFQNMPDEMKNIIKESIINNEDGSGDIILNWRDVINVNNHEMQTILRLVFGQWDKKLRGFNRTMEHFIDNEANIAFSESQLEKWKAAPDKAPDEIEVDPTGETQKKKRDAINKWRSRVAELKRAQEKVKKEPDFDKEAIRVYNIMQKIKRKELNQERHLSESGRKQRGVLDKKFDDIINNSIKTMKDKGWKLPEGMKDKTFELPNAESDLEKAINVWEEVMKFHISEEDYESANILKEKLDELQREKDIVVAGAANKLLSSIVAPRPFSLLIDADSMEMHADHTIQFNIETETKELIGLEEAIEEIVLSIDSLKKEHEAYLDKTKLSKEDKEYLPFLVEEILDLTDAMKELTSELSYRQRIMNKTQEIYFEQMDKDVESIVEKFDKLDAEEVGDIEGEDGVSNKDLDKLNRDAKKHARDLSKKNCVPKKKKGKGGSKK